MAITPAAIDGFRGCATRIATRVRPLIARCRPWLCKAMPARPGLRMTTGPEAPCGSMWESTSPRTSIGRARSIANTQQTIEGLAADLRGLGGDLTIGLDVTGSIASFLEAVLLAEGLALVHVPGIAVNRAAHGFTGGETKSDPRDAL